MDLFTIFVCVIFGLLLIAIVGYTVSTNKVISDQEREITELTAEIEKLKSDTTGLKRVTRRVTKDSDGNEVIELIGYCDLFTDEPLTFKPLEVTVNPDHAKLFEEF